MANPFQLTHLLTIDGRSQDHPAHLESQLSTAQFVALPRRVHDCGCFWQAVMQDLRCVSNFGDACDLCIVDMPHTFVPIVLEARDWLALDDQYRVFGEVQRLGLDWTRRATSVEVLYYPAIDFYFYCNLDYEEMEDSIRLVRCFLMKVDAEYPLSITDFDELRTDDDRIEDAIVMSFGEPFWASRWVRSDVVPEGTQFHTESGRLNRKGLGSKLCREDQGRRRASLTLEERTAMQKSPKRERKEVVRDKRDLKHLRRDPFRSQAGLGSWFKTVNIDASEEVQERVDALTEALEGMSADKFKAAVEALTNNPLDVNVHVTADIIKPASLILFGSVAIMMLWKDESRNWKVMLAAASAPLIAYGIGPLTEYVKRFHSGEMRSQASAQDITKLAGVIFAAVSYMTMGQTTSSRTFEKLLQRATIFERAKGGFVDALSLAIDIFERAINFIRSDILGLDKIELLNKDLPGLRKWCNEVEVLVEKSRAGTLTLDSETAAIAFRLDKESRSFETMKLPPGDALQVRSAMSAYKTALRSICTRFDSANIAGNGTRVEPTAVLTVGSSGVGKSMKMDPLIRKILKRIIAEEDHWRLAKFFYDYVYAYQPELKYLDGYRQQLVVYMDDWGQNVDVAGNPDNEYLTLIRMVNSMPFIAHMADLSSKGNTPFTSKIVFASSNTTRISPNSIICKDACARRFDIIVQTVPKQEYAVNEEAIPTERKLDMSNPAFAGNEYVMDIHEYHVMRVNKGGALVLTGEIWTEDQFVDRFIDVYRSKQERFEKYQRHLNAIVPDPTLKSQVKVAEEPGPSETFDWVQMGEVDDPAENLEAKCPIARIPLLYAAGYGLSRIDFFNGMNDFGDEYLKAFNRGDEDAMFEAQETWTRTTHYRDYMKSRDMGSRAYNYFKCARANFATILGTIKKEMDDELSSITSKYPLLWRWLKWTSFFCVLQFAIKIFIKPFFCSEDKDEFDGESGGPRKTGKLRTKRVAALAKVQTEASRDPNADQVMEKVLDKSLYELTVGPTNERFGLVTFVGGRLAIMPKHFLSQLEATVKEGYLDPNDFVSLRNEFIKSSIRVKVADFLRSTNRIEIDDTDVCFVHVAEAHNHPQISKLFLTKEQLAKPLDLWLSLCGLNAKGKAERFHSRGQLLKHMDVKDDTGDFVLKNAVGYMSHIGPGDCGYLCLLSNLSVGPGKIMGVHVAGSDSGYGVAVVVPREMVDSALAKFAGIDFPAPVDIELKKQCQALPFDGNFVPYHRLEKPIPQPTKTKIVASPMQGRFGPVDKFPAILRPMDGVDPKHLAISRYGVVRQHAPRPLIKKATDAILTHYRGKFSAFRKPRVYSFEEACRGISEVEFHSAVPRRTSAGYPYVMDPKPGFRGKEWYFGLEEEYDFTRPQALQLRDDVEAVLDKARLGERSFLPYVDTLKDELRKASKIAEKNTRLISAISLPMLIACRMYFLDFSIFMMERNINVGIGVGINAYSEDWNILAKRLLAIGSNMVAGDFTGFDTSTYPALYEEILRIIQAFYLGSSEAEMIRAVLFADLYNSIHICGDIVYQWIACMPSGHFLTGVVNSIVCLLLIMMCWMRLVPDRTPREFFDLVYVCTYGDDNIMSISSTVIKQFNQETIATVMEEFGFTYTDDLKSDALVPFRDITEVTFLKRYFRFEPLVSRYVAPLEFSSIKKTLDWTKRGANMLETCRSNVDNALAELSLHESSDFQYWAPMVIAAAQECLDHHPERQSRYDNLMAAVHFDNVW